MFLSVLKEVTNKPMVGIVQIMVIAHTTTDAGAYEANAESDDLRWVPVDEVGLFDLHPGLRNTWPVLIDHVKTSLQN